MWSPHLYVLSGILCDFKSWVVTGIIQNLLKLLFYFSFSYPSSVYPSPVHQSCSRISLSRSEFFFKCNSPPGSHARFLLVIMKLGFSIKKKPRLHSKGIFWHLFYHFSWSCEPKNIFQFLIWSGWNARKYTSIDQAWFSLKLKEFERRKN